MFETKDETFNGWTNKPTWLVKLWIDNDEVTQNEAYNFINDERDNFDEYEASEALKEYVSENMLDSYPSFGLQADLINWTLACVNWLEITKAINQDRI